MEIISFIYIQAIVICRSFLGYDDDGWRGGSERIERSNKIWKEYRLLNFMQTEIPAIKYTLNGGLKLCGKKPIK